MAEHVEFLSPVNIYELNDDQGYHEGQIARHVQIYGESVPDISTADIVLLGVSENRGAHTAQHFNNAANLIRKHFYQLHYWHTDVQIADIGNVKIGALLADSYAAIKSEIVELLEQNKTVVIIGGSHDVTLAQYYAYKHLERAVEVTCIDAEIDLRSETPVPVRNFLMEMFTSEPNWVKHYNHIAFQSYFVHPRLLETIDKLRFDCYRTGAVQENIEDIEPVLRSSNMVSFDISAIKYSDAPANKNSINGLTGVEACMLARFAGMSPNLSSFGIYGYNPEEDINELTAMQISQILWYFVDGKNKLKQEAPISDKAAYNEFHTIFGELETTFIQNKRTRRWWMKMPDGQYIPCTHSDFLQASRGDIPERWLRIQER